MRKKFANVDLVVIRGGTYTKPFWMGKRVIVLDGNFPSNFNVPECIVFDGTFASAAAKFSTIIGGQFAGPAFSTGRHIILGGKFTGNSLFILGTRVYAFGGDYSEAKGIFEAADASVFVNTPIPSLGLPLLEVIAAPAIGAIERILGVSFSRRSPVEIFTLECIDQNHIRILTGAPYLAPIVRVVPREAIHDMVPLLRANNVTVDTLDAFLARHVANLRRQVTRTC